MTTGMLAADRAAAWSNAPGHPGAVADLGVVREGMLELPTFHAYLPSLVATLSRDRALACICVDATTLERSGDHGELSASDAYAQLLRHVQQLRGGALRQSDQVCRSEDGERVLCLLCPPRSGGQPILEALRLLAARIEQALQATFARARSSIQAPGPLIGVGYARGLHNPLIPPEQTVVQVIRRAQASAHRALERRRRRRCIRLQDLIIRGAIHIRHQRICDLRTHQLLGFEALACGPAGGPLEEPEALRSAANRAGLAQELEHRYLGAAIAEMPPLSPAQRIFINVRPSTLGHRDTLLQLMRQLDHHPSGAGGVVLRVDLARTDASLGHLTSLLTEPRQQGFEVAIAGAGVGRSNLEALLAMQPRFVVVSPALIAGVGGSPVKREILAALVRVATAMPARLIADGVACPQDLATLQALGVPYGSGRALALSTPTLPCAAARRTEPQPHRVPPAPADASCGSPESW